MPEQDQDSPRAVQRRRTARPGPLAGGAIIWAFRLLRPVFLLIALTGLTVGLYDHVSLGAHLLRGEAVEGRVTRVEIERTKVYDQSRSTRSSEASLRYPVISYPEPASGKSRELIESVPRDDLEEGDAVTVYVIPGWEDAARTRGWWLVRILSAIIVFAGLAFTVMLFRSWYMVEASFDRAPRRGIGMFHGPAGWVLLALIGVPALIVLWLRLVQLPWLEVNEYVAFIDRPDRLLRIAEQRCPQAGEPLNPCERDVAAIPLFGWGATHEAFTRALSSGDNKRLARYYAALADPQTPFWLDVDMLIWRLAETSDARFAAFLDSAAVIEVEQSQKLLQQVRTRNDKEKLALLAQHGIK